MVRCPGLSSLCCLLAVCGCTLDDRSPETVVDSAGASGVSPGASPGGSSGLSVGVGAELPAPPQLVGRSGSGAVVDAAGDAGAALSSGMGSGAVSAPPDAAVPPSTDDPPCRGCLELVMPVTAPGQSAQYQFQYEAPGLDFSRGSLRWRVQVLPADTHPNYFLTTDVQNGASNSYAGLFENYQVLSSNNFPAGQWVELAVDVSAHPPPATGPGFDYRRVEWVSLTLGTTAGFTGTGTVRLLVDSVMFSGVSLSNSSDFSSGADGLDLNEFQVPEGTLPPIFHP